ncbi:MAG: FecR domain-containing protein [Tannerella sp.]|nr:FecR domain-containing protein [Tannerella sp.]
MTTEKQLYELFTRYINGLYTGADVEALKRMLQSAAGYGKAEAVMEQVWDDCAGEDADVLRQQYRVEAGRLLKRLRRRERRFSLRPLLKYAAAAMLALVAGIALYTLSGREEAVEKPLLTVQVSPGKTRRITFADGSEVILNAASRLMYPESFDRERRVVRLDGEAFFLVAGDPSRPFVVETNGVTVEAIGTSFNVKAHGEDEFLSVTVESGKVQVDMPEIMMRLNPGEQFLLNRTSRDIIRKGENVQETKSWISGGLYFNRTPLRSVINELMRHYNCVIEFEGDDIPDRPVSGAHDNRTLTSVLNSIYYATGIKYRNEAGSNKVILYE